ncbi:hypothetical protein ACVXG7_21165 [Enterobacter hormaechei]
MKFLSEVMIPETREFEFANLGFIPLCITKTATMPASSRRTPRRNRRCMTPHATANSRINARSADTSCCRDCALPEADPAREHRHHQGPPSAGAGADMGVVW